MTSASSLLARLMIAFLIMVGIAACAGKQEPVASSGKAQISLLESLPPPTRTDLLASGRPYLIGPFDKLRIEVFGVADLQRDFQTDGAAAFSFPLIGTVDAAGKSPTEVGTAIAAALQGRFVRNPQVTVNLIESVTQLVTIDGQVSKAGQYPILGRMTLMRAIAIAGGVGEYAKLDDVLIFRDVNGDQYVGAYNLGAVRRGNYADPEVFANDVIIVGDSPRRRLFKDLLQAAPLLTTPLIILSNRVR